MGSPYQKKENESVSDDVVWHNTTVTQQDQVQQKQQKPVVLWFTGLSGSGKSTIANAVESKLLHLNKHSYLLDGDNLRHGLNTGSTEIWGLALKTESKIFAVLERSPNSLLTLTL